MHSHSIGRWTHDHAFLGEHHHAHERRTWGVVALTAAMMIAEIVGGTIFGSIAVVADGWHMGTHVAALAIAALAYLFARRHAHDARFSLGTGKFGELAAFASAIVLAVIAAVIGWESVTRLVQPVAIAFGEAIPLCRGAWDQSAMCLAAPRRARRRARAYRSYSSRLVRSRVAASPPPR